jgi:hypothetical protein
MVLSQSPFSSREQTKQAEAEKVLVLGLCLIDQ